MRWLCLTLVILVIILAVLLWIVKCEQEDRTNTKASTVVKQTNIVLLRKTNVLVVFTNVLATQGVEITNVQSNLVV
ncbi:MAG: hypothetical protein ABDH28_00730, partial [Brevinematia bacterium]